MDRTSLIIGPALCTYNPNAEATLIPKFFTKDDISVAVEQETLVIETSPHGKIDERVMDVKVEASFTPAGQLTAQIGAAWWERYANMVIGSSIFGATDIPFIISSANSGEIHTFPCAAITKLPDVVFSAEKTLLGGMTVTGIRGLAGTSWAAGTSAANGPLYVITASGGSIVDTNFAPSNIITQPYTAVWTGKTGFSATPFESEDGFTVSFDLQVEPRKIDSLGTIDYRFKSLAVMVKCVPIGPTASQILTESKLQYTGAVRGQSYASIGAALAITGADGHEYFNVPSAAIKSAGYRFGSTVLRNGEIGFVAARTFSSGAQQPLFTMAYPT